MKNKQVILLMIFSIVICGISIVYADYLYSSSDVYYENNNSTLTSNNVQNALEELDNKCETKLSQASNCPEGYECTIPICKRATTLHTETCSQTSNYCYADGYYVSGSKGTTTITYGQLGTSGTLSSGDAFDCDVNGDGVYDPDTERFYYVSDYYDVYNRIFYTNYATLIYYSSIESGIASPTRTKEWYFCSSCSSGRDSTYSGPTTSRTFLPTTAQWRDDLLKTTTRNIYETNSSGTISTTRVSNFSYSGYAARLLTIQELYEGCYDGATSITSGGLLSKCRYLFEQTKYSNSGYILGSWLENTFGTTTAWYFQANGSLGYANAATSSYSVRPVIDIKKSYIKY